MSPRNPAPTRAAIVAAASRLLESGGLDAVTLRAVGAEAGVSRSAPYRHFADKAELLQFLAVRTLTEMAAEVRMRSAAIEPVEALLAGSLAYVEYAVAHPNHYLLIFGDAPQIAPVPEAEAAADDAMSALAELVDRVRSQGRFTSVPAREMATVLWVSLHGIAQLQITGHLHEPRTLDGDQRLGDLVALTVRAFGVLWSEDDAAFIGTVAEFPSLSWVAETFVEALKGIEKLVEAVLIDMSEENESIPEPFGSRRFSGKFLVRIPPEAHRQLAIAAAQQKVSLNRLAANRLVGS
ncbi:hypothetical protein FQR65_LT20535 [Abscondita terminalis]|nr:hypothetical protein FQR65_LT20535 [Abscondita terminalis]